MLSRDVSIMNALSSLTPILIKILILPVFVVYFDKEHVNSSLYE
jgi:hypothetical protein